MMDFNIELMAGFLIWSALCLGMLLAERISSRKWKRAAKAMECHANDLQERCDILSNLPCAHEHP